MQLQNEVKSNPKQPSCKKVCAPKNAVSLGEGNTNSPALLLLKILPLAYHHSHCLATTLGFQIFFHSSILWDCTLFYS